MYEVGKRGYVRGNHYVYRDGHAVGLTAKGEEYYLDTQDVDIARQFTWHIDDEGYVTTSVRNWETGCQYHDKLHRVIMGLKHLDGQIVDHISRVKNDNRKKNLRIVTQHQNSMNQSVSSKNKSGVLGVFYRERKGRKPRWVASINIDTQTRQIGQYDTLEEAVQARKQAELQHYGDFRTG